MGLASVICECAEMASLRDNFTKSKHHHIAVIRNTLKSFLPRTAPLLLLLCCPCCSLPPHHVPPSGWIPPKPCKQGRELPRGLQARDLQVYVCSSASGAAVLPLFLSLCLLSCSPG